MGSVGFLVYFESYMAVLGVGRGLIGLVTALRFKTLDSQPDSSNTCPVAIDVHDFRLFHKSCHSFLAWYLSCFRPGRPKSGFSGSPVETKKMREENVFRFVVVSPREVPYLSVSCPFKILIFRSCFKVRSLSRSQSARKSVH